METLTDLIFLGSKIIADGDCSHEIKRCLLLERKAVTNLDSIFKSRDITLSTKVRRGYGFPSSHVWMWELDYKESWVENNWCFWTVVLEKTLESPLDCKEIQPVHPTVLNIHWKDWCWSWNSNTPATWCEELTHLKRPWCWERLRAGGEGDNRGWTGWMASPSQWTWVWASSGSWWWTGRPGVLQSWGHKESHTSERLNLTELNWIMDTGSWYLHTVNELIIIYCFCLLLCIF